MRFSPGTRVSSTSTVPIRNVLPGHRYNAPGTLYPAPNIRPNVNQNDVRTRPVLPAQQYNAPGNAAIRLNVSPSILSVEDRIAAAQIKGGRVDFNMNVGFSPTIINAAADTETVPVHSTIDNNHARRPPGLSVRTNFREFSPDLVNNGGRAHCSRHHDEQLGQSANGVSPTMRYAPIFNSRAQQKQRTAATDFSQQRTNEMSERDWLIAKKRQEENCEKSTNNTTQSSSCWSPGAAGVMNNAFVENDGQFSCGSTSPSSAPRANAVSVAFDINEFSNGSLADAGPTSRFLDLNAIMMLKLKQSCNLSRRQFEQVLKTFKAVQTSMAYETHNLVGAQEDINSMPTSLHSVNARLKMKEEETAVNGLSDDDIEAISVHAVCKKCENVYPPHDFPPDSKCSCGYIILDDNGKPTHPLTTMSLIKRLEAILSMPGVEEAMRRQSDAVKEQLRRDPTTLHDIMGGRIAQELLKNDINGNILLLLGNLDWFAPNKPHSSVSYGALYFSLLNLPINCRIKEAFVLCAALMPYIGKENKKLHGYMRQSVDELNTMKNGFKIKTFEHPTGREFKCFVVGYACDVPACRKLMGFLSHAACVGCSKCCIVLPRRENVNKPKDKTSDYGRAYLPRNFDLERVNRLKSYEEQDLPRHKRRSNKDHREIEAKLLRYDDAGDNKRRLELEKKRGYRETILHEIDYIVSHRHHTLDSMHGFFQGAGKTVLQLWMEKPLPGKQRLITPAKIKIINSRLEQCHAPSIVTRPPSNPIEHIASMKASECMSLHCHYGLLLFDVSILGPEIHTYYSHFVHACRIIIKRSLSRDDLSAFNHHWFTFVQLFALCHGSYRIPPNFHYMCHSVEMLLDFGPSSQHW